MRKIAVGDIGEFWYGDYKEPFVQLEGAVPGHPQGVVLKDDSGKLLCAYCGKTYDNLGVHAARAHGMTARQYKSEVGLLSKSALVSEKGRITRIATAMRTIATNPNFARARDRMKSAGRPAPVLRGSEHGAWATEKLNQTGRCYAQTLAVARSIVSGGRPLTAKNLAKHGIGHKTVAMYFGDIENMRRTLGAADPVDGKNHRLTDEQMLQGLRSVAAEIGRTPAMSDLRRFGLPSHFSYNRRFGTFSEACRRAGLDPNLPQPMDSDLELRVLLAMATVGHQSKAAKIVGVGSDRVAQVLHRYGYPFGPGGNQGPQRRAWAAEMARRIAEPMAEAA